MQSLPKAHKFSQFVLTALLLLPILTLTGCQKTVVNNNKQTSQPILTKDTRNQSNVMLHKFEETDLPVFETIEQSRDQHQHQNQQPSRASIPELTVEQIEAQQRALKQAEQRRRAKMRANIINAQKQQTHTNNDNVVIKDGNNLPAFNRLMKNGVQSLRNKEYNEAKKTFITAQRLAPKSPAVYMYLSEIAIRQEQATQAEMLARKGLLVSQSTKYDKALWKMLYLSAKMRNKTSLMQQARREIAQLSQ